MTNPTIDVDPPQWLAECRGFRVESEGGRVGVVVEVRRDARSGVPAHMVVRAGRIGRRVLLIGARDVEAVMPAGRWLLLRPGWSPAAAERLDGAAG